MAERAPAAQQEIDTVLADRDWAASPLGPPAAWSQALSATFAMIRRSQAQIVLFWGPEFAALYNDAYAPTIGAKHPAAFGSPAREYWAELWHDLEPLLRGVRETGQTFSALDRPFYIERHGYGETAYFDVSYSLVDDDDGGPGGVLCIVSETTARVEAAQAMRESERRLRALVTASSNYVFRLSADWQVVHPLNMPARSSRMAPPAEDWRTVVFDEDVAAIEARLAEASDRRGTLVLEHRMRGGDGSEVWLASRAVPIMDEEGRIVEWFGCSTDVTARHRAEEHQRLLMQELEHRVRNTLAVVQSIAEQTFRDGIDMADARRRFSSRLAALAKANSLLTGERWASASLAGTIEQALKVHQADTARLELAGPDIAIPARTALTLTLALHELATNASKYGAWANDAGMVKLGWSIDPALDGAKAPVLRLDWRERGGPEVAAPRRRGFGSRLVERGLASELEGTVELRFDPAGVTCRVEAPLRSVQRQA